MIDLYQMLEDVTALRNTYPKSIRIRKLVSYYEDKIAKLELEYEEEFGNDVFV